MPNETEIKSERVSTAITPSELKLIEDAAKALSDREHMTITVSDVVRSGALRRAEEILSEAAAA